MTEKRIAGAWLKGCARGIGLRIAATVAVFVALGLLIVCGAVLSMTGIVKDPALLISILAVGFFLLVFGGAGIVSGAIVLSRNQRLDDRFEPLGVTGHFMGPVSREYTGSYGTRRLLMFFHRGPELDLYIQADFGTRLGIGMESALGRAVAGVSAQEVLSFDDPALENLVLSGKDLDWARAAQQSAEVRERVRSLMDDLAGSEIRTITAQPRALVMRVRYRPMTMLTTEAVQGWLDDLTVLAEALEALPAPVERVEPNNLEQTWEGKSVVRRTQGKATIIVLAIVGVVVCVAAIFSAVMIALLSSMS